ncbi:UTRA domain-containing protein [Nonomuraea turcica]|uniref:UTRA domain-containing protein n=1 Tax=Nonomuraea sp. G32 TaxID=3067274 RepID=UPI00273BB034|nr:UTRA domain-containing protein [Nonomuraea sp. G32]MDP4507016.1 UTRA domain-containing protein [Nonomuraea sp. G32]
MREVVEIRPPADIAAALLLADGDTAVVRRRVVLLDEQPVELADSYYPASIARGTRLSDPRKVPGGAITLLASLGYQPVHVEEDVTARPASVEEQRLLQLPNDDWVLVLTRRSRAEDGTPIEVIQMTMVAHGRHLRYTLTL